MKKMCLALVATMCLSSNLVAVASTPPPLNEVYHNITSEGESITGGISELNCEVIEFQDQSYLIAKVPLEIPIVVDTQGNITVPENVKIENLSQDKQIKVSKITATPNTENIKGFVGIEPVDTNSKLFNILLNGKCITGTSNYLYESAVITDRVNWIIDADNELALDIAVKCSQAVYKTPTEFNIGTVEFTLELVE